MGCQSSKEEPEQRPADQSLKAHGSSHEESTNSREDTETRPSVVESEGGTCYCKAVVVGNTGVGKVKHGALLIEP